MDAFAYYTLVFAVGLLVITPLAWFALGTRRAAALTFQPVSVAWGFPAFDDLDAERMRMYRLHPSSGSLNATHEIRDDANKRIGRITLFRYEAPLVELRGCKFRVYDQTDRKHGPLWRGRVGGQAQNSIVLHSEGKAVAEIFRDSGWFSNAPSHINFGRADIEIEVPSNHRRRHPFEFSFDQQTVARVVRPDPTGIAPVTYIAMASRATPEFAAGVLYLATRRQ